MKSKLYRPFMHNILKVIFVFALATLPLGAAFAASSGGNTLPEVQADLAGQPPFGVDPSTGMFSPSLLTTSYSATGVPVAIPDNVPAGICVPIVVADTGLVTDVRLTSVALTHPWIGDLRLRLVHPNGTTSLTVLNRSWYAVALPSPSSGSDFVPASPIQFYDGAANDAELMGVDDNNAQVVCQGALPCDYFPNPDGDAGSLANFAGFDGLAANGTWQFCAADLGFTDVGNINGVTLQVSTNTPVTTAITSTATSPTSTSPIPVTITFSQSVTGFTLGEITVGNGTAGNFAGTGAVYTADITPTAAGSVTVDVAAGVATDAGGTGNAAAPQYAITYTGTAPTVSITSTATDPTSTSPIPVTITFNQSVTGFALGDISVGNGAAGNFAGTGAIYTVDITPTAAGAVTVDVAAGVAVNGGGTGNLAAPQFSITYSGTAPTVSITSTATNPTSTSPIPVTITFSQSVTGFTLGEITVGNGAAGNFAGTGAVYTVDITPTAAGAITVDVAAGVAVNGGGAGNLAAPQFSITYSGTAPTVSINSTATNPTSTSPIPVTITFSQSVTGFTLGEITIGNGAAGNFAGTGAIYTADITPAAAGVVTVDVAAGVAVNGGGAGNLAAPQFSINYGSAVNPTVTGVSLTSVMNPGPASFTVTFNKNVDDPAGNTATDDVTNPANYLIVEDGTNGTFNTFSCLGLPGGDDTQVTVNTVTYDNVTFRSTVLINGGAALPVGRYKLFVCGTTSIVDLIGTPLNGGTDFTFEFTVQATSTPGTSSAQKADPAILPATGFAPGVTTILPAQPYAKTYTTYSDMWLEIQKLGVKMNIVGVPQAKDGWDVTWLGNDAGWLAGSAFPTWDGNTVLTGHVWDALNNPGPFYALKNLGYGDKILIHAWGKVYTYEVRAALRVTSSNVSAVMKHEELNWVTLVTCESYNEKSGTYTYRRLVRAVLVSVVDEK